jgi:hypothetical protein
VLPIAAPGRIKPFAGGCLLLRSLYSAGSGPLEDRLFSARLQAHASLWFALRSMTSPGPLTLWRRARALSATGQATSNR